MNHFDLSYRVHTRFSLFFLLVVPPCSSSALRENHCFFVPKNPNEMVVCCKEFFAHPLKPSICADCGFKDQAHIGFIFPSAGTACSPFSSLSLPLCSCACVACCSCSFSLLSLCPFFIVHILPLSSPSLTLHLTSILCCYIDLFLCSVFLLSISLSLSLCPSDFTRVCFPSLRFFPSSVLPSLHESSPPFLTFRPFIPVQIPESCPPLSRSFLPRSSLRSTFMHALIDSSIH